MPQTIREVRDSGERPQYRVWRAFNIPHNMHFYAVESPEEGGKLIEKLAQLDLANPRIETNAFGLETLEDGGYVEWYSDEDDDIERCA